MKQKGNLYVSSLKVGALINFSVFREKICQDLLDINPLILDIKSILILIYHVFKNNYLLLDGFILFLMICFVKEMIFVYQ